MNIPHGIYIWHIEKIRKDYLEALKKANCKRVYLKVLDDATPGIFWGKQCTKEIIKSFNDNGQEVVGWGYVFDKRTTTDISGITNAVKKAIEAGCIGFVADIESEVENTATHLQVQMLMTALRDVVAVGQLAYTSFGNPESHTHVPWKMLHDICDYQQPQMYYSLWNSDTNTQEVINAFAQHAKFGINKKPIYPIFTCEQNAETKELQTFLDKYPGSSIYAAQLPQAWELNYQSDSASIPAPAQSNSKEIVRWRLNSRDASDLRGLDASGKVVCWLDTEKSLEKMYYGAMLAGAPRAIFTIESMDKKPSSTPPPFPIPPKKTNAQRFVEHFKNNYQDVRTMIESWFTPAYSPNAVKNACVAHIVSNLILCKLPAPKLGTTASINVDIFRDWALAHDWQKIMDLTKLQAGDICVSGPSQTDIDHVFCFVSYKDKDTAFVLHNKAVGVAERALRGGPCGESRFALRMPK